MHSHQSDVPTEAVTVDGHCYCGAVQFTVALPAGARPIFSAYCHCDSCRRAHAAPLYHVVCVDALMFNVTAGASLVEHYTKPGGTITRAFCRQCGTRVMNTFGDWRLGNVEPVVFFPNLLRPEFQHPLPALLRPTRHNQAEE